MDKLSDLLECSVCLENLDSNHKVLPCQHTFCVPCIRDLVGKGRPQVEGAAALPGFLCPECRFPVETPVDRLPSNVILNRLLEGLASSTTSVSTANVSAANNAFANSHPSPEPRPPSRPSTSSLHTVRPPPPTTLQANVPAGKLHSMVPGNLATNPFLSMLTPTAATSSNSSSSVSSPESPMPEVTSPTTPKPVLPPKPPPVGGGGIKPKPASFTAPPPRVPPPPIPPPLHHPPKPTQRPPLPPSQTKRAPEPPGPKCGAASSFGCKPQIPQIYRALYDYTPAQLDELALRKNELYSVIEKCQDGWFKGSSLVTLKTGVFPGNYVVHVNEHLKPTQANQANVGQTNVGPANFQTANKSDLIGFDSLFAPKTEASQPSTAAGAKSKTKTSEETAPPDGNRYEVIETFPASNEYELDLQRGDVVIMVKQRDDGWCKGIHLKSKKTGLFPSSFVRKMRL